jgi:pimeloyl-ACP methyl ester carboxylesterase
MVPPLAIDWSKGRRSGLVSIGRASTSLKDPSPMNEELPMTHLCLYSRGPDRKKEEPVVIIITGLASSSKGWTVVQDHLRYWDIRSYSYDRAGYGGSTTSQDRPTATTIAAELDALLRNAKIDPPYILVAHSWGGIIAREFLCLRLADVAGIVFVDANTENTLKKLDWRDPNLWAVAEGLDYFKVTGLEKEVCENCRDS